MMYFDRLADFLRTAFLIIAGLLLLWAVISLLDYILTGIALSRMAKKVGFPTPALAWVPIANRYLLGSLCERSFYFHTGKQWKFSVIFPVMDILALFAGRILGSLFSTSLFVGLNEDFFQSKLLPTLVLLLGLAGAVITLMALYQLYRDYAPGQEVLYTVLSVIFGGFGQSILLMVIRDKIPLSAASGYGGWGQPGGYPPPPQGGPYQAPPNYPPNYYGWGQPTYQNGPPGSGWDRPPYQGNPGTTGWEPPSAPEKPGDQNGPEL